MAYKRSIPPRIRRTPEHVRDSSLIVIATEGEKTEKKYFESLATKERNPKVNVKILPNIDHKSSPESVMQLLVNFLEKFDLEENDQLWLVIDRDRWKEETLSEVASQCIQKNISLAISNPCFEFWILLHVKNIREYTEDDLKLLFANKKVNSTRTQIERELLNILGSYNKSYPNCERLFRGIHLAIQQAEYLDTQPEHRWPNTLGTRVYKLVKIIIKD